MLKWTGALATAAAVGAVAGVGGDSILQQQKRDAEAAAAAAARDAEAAATAAEQQNYVYTCCPGGACHEECIMKTIVDTKPPGNKILRTERMALGGPEQDWPQICAKGIMSCQMPDMPTRLLYPMKRVGKRGEGKFQRISWDQAISEIGTQLKQIRDKYGVESVATKMSACGTRPTTMLSAGFSRYLFVFGGHSFDHPPVDEGPEFAFPVDFGWPWSGGQRDCRYLETANMVIMFGCNPISTRPAQETRALMKMRDRGGKLVQVGRWFDETAAKADQFIGVNAGSDVAMTMAMCRVMIDENLVDWNFMTNSTVAPFLVRNDNGLFLRESDVVSGGAKTKYVYWDAVSKSAKIIAPGVGGFPFGTMPDLLAAQTVNNIPCKTAFLKLKEYLVNNDITAKSQEAMTGVKADVVTQLTRDYVKSRPSTLMNLWGYRYQNEGRLLRSLNLLACLSGNMGLELGRIVTGVVGMGNWPMYLNTGFLSSVAGMTSKSKGSVMWKEEVDAAATQKPFPVKAMIIGDVLGLTYPRKQWQSIYQQAELLVQLEFRFTDNTAWMDYLLPDRMQFEDYELALQGYNRVTLQEPAIKPRGEAKESAEFWYLVAKQLGGEKYFANEDGTYKTQFQWLKEIIDKSQPGVDPTYPVARAEVARGVTWDRVLKEKSVRMNVPTTRFPGYVFGQAGKPEGQYNGVTGRMEFYHEEFADIDEAMPKITQPWINGGGPGTNKALVPDRKKYPLQYVSYRERLFMQGQFNDVSTLNNLVSGGTGKAEVWINPALASARGINEGDTIEILNAVSSAHATAHISERFPPDMVNVSMAFRRDQYLAGDIQSLNVPPGGDDVADTLTSKLVWAYKNSPVTWGHAAWDILWDNCCDIRKSTPTNPNPPLPPPPT